ncbi:hypothetical protein SB719_22640, partial [Pantoea sp. SIMBA_079]
AQNSAVPCCPVGIAVALGLEKLFFQHIQFTNTGLNVVEMFIYQGINRTSVWVRLAARLQQHADFFMGHIERPAAPDK